jgi:hypothetical protein
VRVGLTAYDVKINEMITISVAAATMDSVIGVITSPTPANVRASGILRREPHAHHHGFGSVSAQINRVFNDSLAAEIDRRHLNIIAIVNASQQIVWTKTRSKVVRCPLLCVSKQICPCDDVADDLNTLSLRCRFPVAYMAP